MLKFFLNYPVRLRRPPLQNLKGIFCFLLSTFYLLQPCFAQSIKPQENPARFVYQSSGSLAYGVGKIFEEDTAKGTFPNRNFSFEVQQLLAYQFNHYVFTGAGAGLDFWFCDKKMSVFVPIFANVTVKFINKKMAPFLFANVGYAFKWQVEKKLEENVFYGTSAGLYFQAGLGFNIKFSEKLSLLFSPYYKLQQSTNQYRESQLLLASTQKQLFHFLGFKIGLLY